MNDVHGTVAAKLRSLAHALSADVATSNEGALGFALQLEVGRLNRRADELDPPKPVPTEPTGDVVVFVLGAPYWPRDGGVHWVTYNHSNNPPTWEELIDGVDPYDGIQIYRRELPQSDATGALPTSPSPEVGVATSPPVASPIDKAWRVGYELGTENTRARHIDILTALKPDLITAVEKTAIDKAIAAIKADAENTVTGRGFPS